MFAEARNKWLKMADEELFSCCQFDPFKASGRGGQKRNKTSSAVRLTHVPTQISVTDCSGRSQHQNRQAALWKLRLAIAFQIRGLPELSPSRDIGLKNPGYPLWVASVLDILDACGFQIGDAAEEIGESSSKLVKLLYRDLHLWQLINHQREKRGFEPLKRN